MRFEVLVKRDLHELLITSASDYHKISDDDLLAYVKGAAHRYNRLPALISLAGIVVNGDERVARYQREIFLYRQIIFAFSASSREGQKQGMLPIRFRTLCLIKNF